MASSRACRRIVTAYIVAECSHGVQPGLPPYRCFFIGMACSYGVQPRLPLGSGRLSLDRQRANRLLQHVVLPALPLVVGEP